MRRFSVVSGGRRWGKSQLGIDRAITPALEGYPVGWFSPTYKMLTEVWRTLVYLLQPVTRRVSQQDHRLELITRGVIEMWSLDMPDVARGRKYKRLLVDEAAMVPNLLDIWSLILRPTLADYAGDADFYSTPRGLNDFHTLWQWGQDADHPEWASWQRPTADNPYIPASEIEAMRRDMTSLQFSQEVLAEFVNLSGGLFRREWFPILPSVPADVPLWVRPWDLAASVKQTADYTAGAKVGLRPDGTLVVADMVRGRWEWPQARQVIVQTALADGPAVPLGIERVAFQLAALQELQRDPVLVQHLIRETVPDKDKVARAMPWAARAEAGAVALVAGAWVGAFLDEVCDFPQGPHDDQVDTVSAALPLLTSQIRIC